MPDPDASRGMPPKGISVAVAVDDLQAAVALYRNAFGLPTPRFDTSAEDRIQVAVFDIGESQLQLLAASDDDSLIARDIAARGEGLHHFGFVVHSVEEMLARLSDKDIRTLAEHGRQGAFGNCVGFVHPKSMRGALVELIEPDGPPAAAC